MTNSDNPGSVATNATNATDTLSFEQAFEKLQQTVRRLESGELSLEDSLKGFEEGVRLTRLCQTQLSAAEQRIELLTAVQADGTVQTQPFTGQSK